ncbi:unnamed protein product [Caenorhabditis angaria]|uniref:Uncharacterized protein n=1 Tax=Caenorhabditis angaria TaxID=860376 RepID=A0A9P1MY15_9PELO|nr:unnamed protein product [Caenorhabditis angaria]
MILLPYQYGLIKINESNPSCSIWWTGNVSEMIIIDNFKTVKPLYIASLCYWHFVYSLYVGIGGVVIERLAATYFIKDYEQKSRKYIPIILIGTSHLFSIPFALQAIEYQISFAIVLGLIVVLMVFLFITYFVVLRINQQIVNSYTLSERFQVIENLRALVIIRKFVILFVVYKLLACILFFLLVFKYITYYAGFLNHILESVIYMCPMCFSVGIMNCADSWNREFWSFLPSIFTRKNVVYDARPNKKIDATDMYFEQLANSWQ